MRPLPLLLAVALLALAAGCGSRQAYLRAPGVQHQTTDIETGEGVTYSISQIIEHDVSSGTVQASVDEAWKALPEVYRVLGVPVTMVDPGNRLLGTTDNRLARIGKARPSRYLDCGSGLAGQYANIYQVYVTVATQVRPAEGGGAAVHTQLEAAARDAAHNNNAIRCTTKGVLEKEILQALQVQLAGGAAG